MNHCHELGIPTAQVLQLGVMLFKETNHQVSTRLTQSNKCYTLQAHTVNV